MDTLRLITVGAGGQITIVRDYENGSTYLKARGSFKATMPVPRQVTTSRDRRFAGGRVVSESHDNGTISWTAEVSGATTDIALANVSAMIADLRYAGSTLRFIEFRADGATYSTLYEIRGPATVQTNYDWARMAGVHSLEAEVQIPVAPLVRGLPMDILDDFSVDTESDYTYDASTAADTAISGGVLTPVVGAALSVERRMRHTVRGYTYLDMQATVKATTGATITSYKVGVALRASAATRIEVYIDDNGTNSRLRIDSVVAGVTTNRATTNTAARLVNGNTIWVRGRVEGNVVIAEYFLTGPQPTPMGSPLLTNTYTLTAAEQASFVAGHAGLTWIAQSATATIDDFVVEPFTYTNRTIPEELPLRGTIPGDTAALADVTITHAGGSNVPVFALLGWTERPTVANLVWNGDFEQDADGWVTSVVTGVQAVAGTSIARVTSSVTIKYGTAVATIVTPASSGAGASFILYKRFKKGVTYTASLWGYATASVTSMVLKLGTNGDVATSAAAALTTTPTVYTVAWTPTADRDSAVVSFQTNAATATTCQIDGVMVYEGITAPVTGRHAEGAGAPPVFGTIEAEASDTGDLTGWTVTADAGSRGGFLLFDSAVAGAETYTAGWFVDPSLMLPDDFTLGEIDIEVWARMAISSANVSPRAVLSARPEAGTNFGAERFTAEWQTTGLLMTKPLSGGRADRMVRLGTLTLPVDSARPARWKLWLACSTAVGSTGSFGCDYLMIAPTRYRCSGPSGKVNDTTYPKFMVSGNETAKTITSDLRGLVSKPPLAATGDRGLGGTPLELPPGSTDLFVKLSSLVPDDPTSDATTEQLSHTATIHVAVWPRYHAYRSS